jgi:excisionase family DNA binding protein
METTQSLPPGEYITVPEAAAYLRLHPRTVYRFVKEGHLPGVTIGSAVRIRRQELLDFLAAPQSTGSAR